MSYTGRVVTFDGGNLMNHAPSFSYEPLWATMKEKGISTYKLINTYNFNKGTLYHLKRGDNVKVLCQILECRIEDVVEIIY